MKGSGKIILSVMLVTSFFVLYIHGQVALFQISYSLDSQMDIIEEKAEGYRRLKFDVERLKAPRRLEKKLQELSFNLTIPDQVHVVRVAPSPSVPVQSIPELIPPSISNRVLDFFGKWIGVAQAKTEN